MRKVQPHEVADMDENEFIKMNVGIVHDICKRMYSEKVKRETGFEYEDLVQIGLIALVRAKRNFDPKLGLQFTTYAYPAIWGEIARRLRDSTKVKVARSIREAYNMIVKAGLLMEDAEVIAEELDMPVSRVKVAKELKLEVYSTDEEIDDEVGKATFLDTLSTGESAADIAEDNLTINEFLSTLSPQHRYMWEIYSRTNCGTQQEIAKEMGISQVQVGRILKAIFLKAEKFGDKLRSY